MISVYSDEKGKEHATGSEAPVPRFSHVEALALGMYKRVALNVAMHERRAQDVVHALLVVMYNLVKTTGHEMLNTCFKQESDLIFVQTRI